MIDIETLKEDVDNNNSRVASEVLTIDKEEIKKKSKLEVTREDPDKIEYPMFKRAQIIVWENL